MTSNFLSAISRRSLSQTFELAIKPILLQMYRPLWQLKHVDPANLMHCLMQLSEKVTKKRLYQKTKSDKWWRGYDFGNGMPNSLTRTFSKAWSAES